MARRFQQAQRHLSYPLLAMSVVLATGDSLLGGIPWSRTHWALALTPVAAVWTLLFDTLDLRWPPGRLRPAVYLIGRWLPQLARPKTRSAQATSLARGRSEPVRVRGEILHCFRKDGETFMAWLRVCGRKARAYSRDLKDEF